MIYNKNSEKEKKIEKQKFKLFLKLVGEII